MPITTSETVRAAPRSAGPKPGKAPTKKAPTITITDARRSPVLVTRVNGRAFELPVGTPIPLPDEDVMAALDGAGIEYTKD